MSGRYRSLLGLKATRARTSHHSTRILPEPHRDTASDESPCTQQSPETRLPTGMAGHPSWKAVSQPGAMLAVGNAARFSS